MEDRELHTKRPDKNFFRRVRDLFPNSTVKIECYRCNGCSRVITNFDIKHLNKTKSGEACRCGVNEFRPTNPTLIEKFLVVLKHIIRGY